MAKKLVFPKTVKAKVYRELVGYDPLKDAVFDYDILLLHAVNKGDFLADAIVIEHGIL